MANCKMLSTIILLGAIIRGSEANYSQPPTIQNPRIRIAQGTLIGRVATDIRGNPYYSFQGIPYATPPLGNLRFKSPQPPQPWTGAFNATKLGDACIGIDILATNQIIGSENCLVLNVYTNTLPNKYNKKLRPVFFWVHGAGFIAGSGGTTFYGPDFLLGEDIVIVTINYRLGLLGWLSLETPSLGVPGNAGFKDMVLALKWVQNNIASFGGDRKQVTLAGESAAGSGVHALYLSPNTKGLFSRVIAQSGSALSPWLTGTKGAKGVAVAANMSGASEAEVLDYLMDLPALDIFAIQLKIRDFYVPAFHRPIGLVVERNSPDPFLTDTPINIILSRNFVPRPIIFGFNSEEGLNVIAFSTGVSVEDPDYFENLIPWYFGYHNGTGTTRQIGRQIKSFYYGNQQPGPNNTIIQYKAMTDSYFVYEIYVSTLLHARLANAPVYSYRLSLETGLNTAKVITNVTLPGTCHFDDIGYLFRTWVTPTIVPGSIEDLSSRKVTKLWSNFVKTGNPTPPPDDPLLNVDWNPITVNNPSLLDIGPLLEFIPFPKKPAMTFWRNLCLNSPAGRRQRDLC